MALGPKCHVTCLDAQIGERIWAKDLVSDFGTVIPPWYAGQCPLIDGDRVMMETLVSIRRAGADLILTYFAKRAAELLKGE